uniref:Uncharacterized protein n=1 Tax=Romanomermis culicivorax TaxID=13658 RepID=A0A915JFG3_ROMCU
MLMLIPQREFYKDKLLFDDRHVRLSDENTLCEETSNCSSTLEFDHESCIQCAYGANDDYLYVENTCDRNSRLNSFFK